MDYERFFNTISASRNPAPTRILSNILANSKEKLICLYQGSPNPESYPFVEMTAKTSDGTEIKISGKGMNTALQYNQTPGIPDLIRTLKEFTTKTHNLTENFWNIYDLQITNGSQDGLCKTAEMFLEQGTSILVPEIAYAGFLAMVKPYHPNMITIQSDDDGMIPEKLKEVLESSWKPSDVDTDPSYPKFLYLNPTGANPTGINLIEERRHEIYDICAKYKILILDDDPYYFIQFHKERIASFLSMDTVGIVMRFESFSKILSAGMRVGFVIGPKPLMYRLGLHTQISTIHASTIAQVMVSELFKIWGYPGLMKQVEKIERLYRDRRDFTVRAAEKYLTGLCTWKIPDGGLFLWVKVLGIEDTEEMIMVRAVEKKVLMLSGNHYYPDSSQKSPYARISFSVAPLEDIETGIRFFAEMIKEEMQRK